MREDGLSARQMNISYCGAVVTQRTSKINEVGKYTPILSFGDTHNRRLKLLQDYLLLKVLRGEILNFDSK